MMMIHVTNDKTIQWDGKSLIKMIKLQNACDFDTPFLISSFVQLICHLNPILLSSHRTRVHIQLQTPLYMVSMYCASQTIALWRNVKHFMVDDLCVLKHFFTLHKANQ